MKSETQKIRKVLQGTVIGLALLGLVGCSSTSENTTAEEGVTITEVRSTSSQSEKLEKEDSASKSAEKVAVYIDPSVERVWQNGPSPEALRQKAYRKKSKARISGKRNSQGNNTPVLIDIPPSERGAQPFHHGLDP